MKYLRIIVSRVATLGAVLLIGAACATHLDSANAARIHSIALIGFENPTVDSAAPQFDPNHANLRLGSELKVAVMQALTKAGYVISNDSGISSDTVLRIEVTGVPIRTHPYYGAPHGFIDQRHRAEPEFAVKATLTDSKSKATLFSRLYLYKDAFMSPADGSLLIRPDEKYTADVEHAVEAFRDGETQIANAIAVDLKRP